jgi:hypothetical protein
MTKAIPLLIALVAACGSDAGGTSPQQACDDVTSALCERLYACFQPSELAAAGYPASESACITMMQAAQGCTAKTLDNVCTGNAQYQPDEAARCGDQVTGLTCAQIRDPFFDTQTAAPACGLVCKVPS